MSGRSWRRGVGVTVVLATGALLVASAAPRPGAPATAVDALGRVQVTVELTRPVDGLPADALHAYLAAALQRAVPAVGLDAGAADRLRLRVALESRSANELRGFWLPFSGTYAIGLVALALERPVILPAPERSATAVVWREDRVVAVPWGVAAAAVRRATDAMVAALQAARAGP